ASLDGVVGNPVARLLLTKNSQNDDPLMVLTGTRQFFGGSRVIKGGPIRQGLRRADAIECREAARDNADKVFPVRGCLPVFAQWDEWHVDPTLLVHFGAEPLLFALISRVEPSGAQSLNLRAVGPAVDWLLTIGTDRQVAVRVNVRQ